MFLQEGREGLKTMSYFWKNGTRRWGVFVMEPMLTRLG